jgi:myo-inositol 2-dehydrogenase / D-chiro-inositol 1-dehydrogenase
MENKFSRRKFLGSAAAVSAVTSLGTVGTIGSAGLLTSCSGKPKKKYKNIEDLKLPPLLDKAPDGRTLKAGLIGCGGRGTGAAVNFLKAGNGLEIAALGDLFEDRMKECRETLKKEKNVQVADDKCFLGFDAFQKVIDSGVDIVILATPPHFRPKHFAAAVNAGKHVFMEKPVAVDPVGARSIMTTAKKAESLGLSVVTGTQRRHEKPYVEIYKQIMDGAIGDLVSANVYWNQNQLWFRNRETAWSDMEAMVRDWVNWSWLSGDHIVEQHVHNLDVANWFMGKHPVKAVGFGARHRRVTGDQYDMFSIDYVYEDGSHLHSMCRQIDGCASGVYESFMGTEGYATCNKAPNEFKICKHDGTVIWEFAVKKVENAQDKETKSYTNPYDQEHIDLVTAIRTNKPINEAENTAISTLVGVMGRISAYTGKEVTWEEMMSSELKVGPEEYALGPVKMEFKVPVPGEGKPETK